MLVILRIRAKTIRTYEHSGAYVGMPGWVGFIRQRLGLEKGRAEAEVRLRQRGPLHLLLYISYTAVMMMMARETAHTLRNAYTHINARTYIYICTGMAGICTDFFSSLNGRSGGRNSAHIPSLRLGHCSSCMSPCASPAPIISENQFRRFRAFLHSLCLILGLKHR